MKELPALVVALLLFSGLCLSQEQYGNVRGVVIDEQGIPLPGVAVSLDSELYTDRAVVTTESGIFRFINLAPGICLVKCEMPGFRTYVQENIIVRVGGNVDLKITMKPSTMEEEVTVVAESPVIDMKKTGTAVNVTQDMLQEIPSARDPWVILKQLPGIVTNKENVGGSESGQQASFKAKGTWPMYSMWNMDGVPITDMYFTGSSSLYYDFDSFEEMQVVTSGQDASIQTGGVSINFITRRGGNKFQVVTRAFFTNDSLQGENRTQELIDLDYVGNQINQILDYGIQVGGPIKKDRAWFWLGYGVQDIRHYSIDGFPDDTKLEGINAKLNLRLSRHNRAELAIIRNTKVKSGRGAGPTRPPETTYDQASNGAPLIKFEDEHMFSDNFLLSLKLSTYPLTFWLDPKGGARCAGWI